MYMCACVNFMHSGVMKVRRGHQILLQLEVMGVGGVRATIWVLATKPENHLSSPPINLSNVFVYISGSPTFPSMADG